MAAICICLAIVQDEVLGRAVPAGIFTNTKDESAEGTPRRRASGCPPEEDEGAPVAVAIHFGARAGSEAALDPGCIAM